MQKEFEDIPPSGPKTLLRLKMEQVLELSDAVTAHRDALLVMRDDVARHNFLSDKVPFEFSTITLRSILHKRIPEIYDRATEPTLEFALDRIDELERRLAIVERHFPPRLVSDNSQEQAHG